MSDSDRRHNEPNQELDAELQKLGKSLRSQGSIKHSVMHQISEEAAPQDYPPTVSKPSPSGGLTMLQKFSLGSLAASLTLIAAFGVSNSVLVRHSLADVIENIREVSSYQATMRIESKLAAEKQAIEQSTILYWQATGGQRMDSSVKMPGRPLETKTTNIRFPDEPGIELNVPNKTFRVLPAAAGAPRSPLMAMQQLASYRGNNAKDLGTKQIDGTDCYGFEIALQEVDENILDGSMSVWVAKQSDLPVEIHMDVFPGVTMVTEDFEWNKQFDANLFDATAPKGFTEQPSRARVPDEEIAEHITASLAVYAKYSDGKYPPVAIIYGDIIAARLRKLAGFAGPPFDQELLRSDAFQEVNSTNEGFAHMTVLMRESSEAQYFGKTVGPGDREKVLFRWKRADGKMHFIYGDLTTKVE